MLLTREKFMTAETADIMERAEMLPIDLKLELVDRLLESISPSQKEIDELWKIEVERRVEEVRSGKVKTIPGEQVFAEIEERFGK
jgi:putative addiction module component (TIGR02574 family)